MFIRIVSGHRKKIILNEKYDIVKLLRDGSASWKIVIAFNKKNQKNNNNQKQILARTGKTVALETWEKLKAKSLLQAKNVTWPEKNI